jgi:hypothetical protein
MHDNGCKGAAPGVRALMLLRYFVSARVSCARSLSTNASFLRSWPCREADGHMCGRCREGAVVKIRLKHSGAPKHRLRPQLTWAQQAGMHLPHLPHLQFHDLVVTLSPLHAL